MLNFLHRLFRDPAAALSCGPCVDTVTSTGTAIGASLAATTIVAGDSFQVKNQALTAKALFLQAWVKNQAAGMVRFRSPKFHDNVDGIRARVQSGSVDYVLPWGWPQYLTPQDVMIVELAGSAVGGQIEDVMQLLYYSDLPGQNSRLFDAPTIMGRFTGNIAAVRAALTLATTAGYGGQKALNADVDLLKANTDYALFGMFGDIRTAGLCLRGPDTGNLRYSVPGEITKEQIAVEWTRRLSRDYNLPLIPVINSANKGATLIDAVSDQAGGTCNVTILLGELK